MGERTEQGDGSVGRGEGQLSVLIVGASFAGLAAAYWMQRLGHVVTVVEVAKTLRRGGTPVDIREGVVEVVRRMGLLDRIAASSLPPRSMEFLDGRGVPVARMAGRAGDAGGPDEGYEIERDVLLEMLFSEVRDGAEFRFGESVARLEQTADEVAVTFTSGDRRSFGVVLGCDGTHSAVRRMCFGEEAEYSVFLRNYFGLTIVNKLLIEEDTSLMFNVPGRAVMLSAYNGKTDIAFCFASEQEVAYDRRNREQQKQMVREPFEGNGWRIPELLDEMSRGEDFYFDKLCQIRMGSWSRGRVALVGDAAYCPSPAAGMGGSMAILGAAALADAMERYPGNPEQAFREYDNSFRPTAEAIQREAVEEGLAIFMPATEEEIAARNAMLTQAERRG